MRGKCLVVLVGNIGQDPAVHHTGSGSTIATINVATTEQWKDKQTGEQQERTEWTRCKAFGRSAEILAEYAKKGRQIYVEGKLRTEKYEKDGIERYATDVIIDEFQLLGSDPNRDRAPQGETRAPAPRPSNGYSNGNGANGNGHANGHALQRSNGNPPPPQRNAQGQGGTDWSADSEIPF